jgi:hypothetical protein
METVVALGVLGIGTAAIVSLVTQVHQAATKSSYQTASLDLFAAFSSQVRAAHCDVAPENVGMLDETDPGLVPNATPYSVPALNSSVTLVGDFAGPTQIQSAPPMRLTYVVLPATTPPDGPPLLEIEVTVRELTGDAARDAQAMGSWIRNFRLAKVCNLRTDNATGCLLGNPPCGRGEYY